MKLDNSFVDSYSLVGRYIIRDPDRWPNKHVSGPTAYANYTMIKNFLFQYRPEIIFLDATRSLRCVSGYRAHPDLG